VLDAAGGVVLWKTGCWIGGGAGCAWAVAAARFPGGTDASVCGRCEDIGPVGGGVYRD
jgi:hypothetical protein